MIYETLDENPFRRRFSSDCCVSVCRELFYNYAVVPSEKDFLDEDTPGTTQTSKETDAHKWFSSKENRSDWTITKRRSEIISDLSSC